MIYTNDETRTNVTEGAKILYDAVSTTLGPKGRNVLIKNKFGEFKVTHDGVTVAKAVQLNDDPRAVGADLLRDASLKMEEIGDGTTSVTVLAYNLIVELNKLIDKGENPMMLKRELEAMIEPLIAEVDKMAVPVDGEEAILNVAKISVGGDEELARLITDVMTQAGLDSLIAVEETNSLETTGSVAEGYSFDNGFLSPHMITEKETRSAVLERPAVVYITGGIAKVEDMVAIFNGVGEAGYREVLFVVESIADEPLDMVVFNNIKQNVKATVVKAPGFDEDQRQRMLDMATITGGGVIDTALDDWKQYLTPENFGTAKRVVVKANDTLIVADLSEETDERVELIRGLIEKESDDVALAKLHQRLAALTGGVGLIKVGGVNPSEVSEKKYRIDDAIGAVRAAMEGGIVPGGGVALRDVQKTLSGEGIVVAVADALIANEKTLVANSGYEVKNLADLPAGEGVNVTTGETVNMLDAGIIDPAIVTKGVILNAFTVAGLAITVGGSIVDRKLSQEELMRLMEAKA